MQAYLPSKLAGVANYPAQCACLAALLSAEIPELVKAVTPPHYRPVCSISIGSKGQDGVVVSGGCLWDLHAESFATFHYVNPMIFWYTPSIWSEPCGMRGLGPMCGSVLESGRENSAPGPSVSDLGTQHPPGQGQLLPRLTVNGKQMSTEHLRVPLPRPLRPHALLSSFASGWNYVSHVRLPAGCTDQRL